jgi:hypothetical protein
MKIEERQKKKKEKKIDVSLLALFFRWRRGGCN